MAWMHIIAYMKEHEQATLIFFVSLEEMLSYLTLIQNTCHENQLQEKKIIFLFPYCKLKPSAYSRVYYHETRDILSDSKRQK